MTLVVGGEGSQRLASAIRAALGAKPCGVEFRTFPDGEEYVRLLEPVQGQDVVVVQTTFPPTRLVLLLLLLQAARDGGARSVRAVVPYLAYQRQDRVFKAGEALSARLVADLLSMKADEVLTVELHKAATRDFFRVPVRNLEADSVVAEAFRGLRVDVVLAPDAGARDRAERVAARMGASADHLEKTRRSSTEIEIKPKTLVVRGKRVAVLDDIISTGGTMAAAVTELRRQGAAAVYAVGIHGLLLDDAAEKLRKAGADQVLCCDTIESTHGSISVAPLLVEALLEKPPVKAR